MIFRTIDFDRCSGFVFSFVSLATWFNLLIKSAYHCHRLQNVLFHGVCENVFAYLTSIVRKRTNLVSVIQKHSVNKFSCIGATNAWEVERASVSEKGGLETLIVEWQ